MKIVFPTDENNGYLSKRGAHFGKAKFYTLVTLENNEIVDVQSLTNAGHKSGGCSNAVANIMALEPDALVVSGIGNSPAKGFANAGLTLYVDKNSATVEESVAKLTKNGLKSLGTRGTCSIH